MIGGWPTLLPSTREEIDQPPKAIAQSLLYLQSAKSLNTLYHLTL